jgi:hypothetical protein
LQKKVDIQKESAKVIFESTDKVLVDGSGDTLLLTAGKVPTGAGVEKAKKVIFGCPGDSQGRKSGRKVAKVQTLMPYYCGNSAITVMVRQLDHGSFWASGYAHASGGRWSPHSTSYAHASGGRG